MEAVAETDDALMEKFFDGEEITIEELMAGIRSATIRGLMTPVLCGTAYRNKGVQPLHRRHRGLPALAHGHPADSPEWRRATPRRSLERRASDDEPFSALAFKIMADPFVGKLAFMRVYSGVLKSGSYVYNSTKGKRERVGRILRMHANHREEVDEVCAGDIVGIVGFKDTTTGDTLCDEKNQIILESMEFPKTGHPRRD